MDFMQIYITASSRRCPREAFSLHAVNVIAKKHIDFDVLFCCQIIHHIISNTGYALLVLLICQWHMYRKLYVLFVYYYNDINTHRKIQPQDIVVGLGILYSIVNDV